MKIWDLSIKKPVTVFMGLVCILVMGFFSQRQLKLAFLPKVSFPGMWVQVNYPDQNPEILERTVTKPMEEAFSTLPGLKKINSFTNPDSVGFWLEFDWESNVDMIRLDLGLKIEEIRPTLPKDIQTINIFNFNTEDMPVVRGRISAPGVDLSENYDLLERYVQKPLERIPGVAKVDMGGVLPKEVSIELRLDKIQEHQVDVGEVVRRLSRDNMVLSAGKINTNGLVFNLRGDGKIRELDEYSKLVVTDQGLTLGDIADILYEEPPIGYARTLDGSPALALEVFKESTANTVEVANAVTTMINGEIADNPHLNGVSFFVWEDQAEEITNGLTSLTQAGLYGALFAVIVLFLFLRRIGATLIITTAIPISIIGTFIFMYAFGNTLNILTLMGLMLAVGMLVDNAVVVLESIYQKALLGMDKEEATREGTKEVIVALIAATSTTMIVFLSLVIADKNQLSVWLKALGVTICFALVMSLLVSTTVIPLFASKIIRRFPQQAKEKKENLLLRAYKKVLYVSMARPGLTTIAMLLVIGSMIIPAGQVGKNANPASKTKRLYLEYEFHDYFFLSDVKKVSKEVEAFIEPYREKWNVDSVYTWMAANEGTTIISFKEDDKPAEEYNAIRQEIRDNIPEVAGVAFRFDDDENDNKQSLSIQLFGPDAYTLRKTGEKIADLLAGVEGFVDIRNGEMNNKRELRVTVDRQAANEYGISPQQISEVFGFTLGYTYLPRFQTGNRETDVTIGLRIEDRATIDDVARMKIGEGVPLGSVAHFEFSQQPDQIRRRDRKVHHRVRAAYEGENFGEAKQEVEALMESFELPAGVAWSWNDRMIREAQEKNTMFSNVILALALIYIVMACLFESVFQPLAIFITIIFSMVGVFWGIFATKTEFEVMAIIGIFILVGVVVNNGIIMMDRINQLRAENMHYLDAVREGAHQRIRPILMTAATTIIGLIPMAIGSSSMGGSYYYPLARTVIFGLTASTLLTLIGLPWLLVVGFYFRRFLVWFMGLFFGRERMQILFPRTYASFQTPKEPKKPKKKSKSGEAVPSPA